MFHEGSFFEALATDLLGFSSDISRRFLKHEKLLNLKRYLNETTEKPLITFIPATLFTDTA